MTRKGRRRGLGRRLWAEERQEIIRRYRSGEPAHEVAAAIGCSVRTVYQVDEDARLAEGPGPAATSGLRLGFAEREQISRGIAAGLSAREIGRRLGRAGSTISREIAAAGGRGRYGPWAPSVVPWPARPGPGRPSSRVARDSGQRWRRASPGAGPRSRYRPD